ncbi:MAG: NAD(P)/FAD-dependent oxidoreductase [Rhodospirillaceae bacterium]
MSEVETQIAVIGAGPVGLFSVFQCGMLGMSCHVVDALDHLGGQCAALYPEKPIYDIPGLPQATGSDLVARLTEQAAPFQPVYHLGQQVSELTPTDDGGWRLATSDGTLIRARAVIVAAGVGAFAPKRPPLPGIEQFETRPEGHGVHYAVRDREAYRGRRVVIAGGGDSAVDWATDLAGFAAAVYLVHRRDAFRAQPASLKRLRALAHAGTVEMVVPAQLRGVEGDGGDLAAVLVGEADAERRIEADALLAFYGLAQSLGPIAEWGLELERNRVAVDPTTAETSLPGVYAVGDIAHYPHKLKLILTGFSEATFAAHAAYARVFPGQALHFEYSTTKGLPGGA